MSIGAGNTILKPATAAKVSFWSKVWHGITVAEHAVISAMKTAAGAVPEVETLVNTYGPEASTLLNTIDPGTGKYATVAANAAATVGQLLEDGGNAAEQNLLNVGFDQTLINDVKSLWTNLKASTHNPPPSAAPTPLAK